MTQSNTQKQNWRFGGPPKYVPSNTIRAILEANRPHLIDLVARTYKSFYDGDAVNPDTYSLKFPQKTDSRINALPAYLGGDVNLAGLKWVSSFPKNVKSGRQRASAIIVVNSFDTGYPLAILDGTMISAARTAASAALAARLIVPERTSDFFTIFGAGIINKELIRFLVDDGWTLPRIEIRDMNSPSKTSLESYCRELGCSVEDSHEHSAAVGKSDLISMATSALEPWYDRKIEPHQTVLHISLRDIKPSRLADDVQNIVDDVNHAVKANTSLHLLQQADGAIPNISDYRALLATSSSGQQPTVVSAFGMGILDLAFASFVLDEAERRDQLVEVPGLLPDMGRW